MTTAQLLIGLKIAALVMVLVLLYHLLFIAVDLRKIMRRLSDLTREVEDVIMKPISMIDYLLEWVVEALEQGQKSAKSKKKKKKKGKK